MISMFQTWRWKLRAAQQACQQDRLDEAVELLRGDDLQQFQPAQGLIDELAGKLARRALLKMASAEPVAAWQDLRTACGLVGEKPDMLEARRQLAADELNNARRQLAGGQPHAARSTLERLVDEHAGTDDVRQWLEIAQRCAAATHLLARGQFAEAEAESRQAAGLRPDATFLATRHAELAQRVEAGRQLTDQLQAAATGGDWGQVRILADDLLRLAPECEFARDLRRRAWARIAPVTEHDRRSPRVDLTEARSTNLAGTAGLEPVRPGQRFLLWVDAVGGFLVCLGNEVRIGQPVGGAAVDVPILGDLSRQHATIRRDGENYVICPLQSVRVRGQVIREATLLRDGDELGLGANLRLRFRQPHVLSASARLEWISRHRSQPSADAILLMAESLVLGPDRQNHVACRNWSHDLVLYRRDGSLYCRSAESLEVDGRWCQGEAPLELRSRIVGRNFAVSLEPA